MSAASRFALAALVSLSALVGSLTAADWPAFRGARGGFADDKDLPAQVTADNILWKLKLPGLGASSPITTGNKLFVTCYAGYGTTLSKGFGGGGKGGKGGKGGFGKGGGATGDQKKLKLLLVCVDRAKGTVAWQKEIEPKLPEVPWTDFIREHGYASSTPATDGERVYAFFGKSGVVAFDLQGKQLWQASVGTRTDKWGTAASPILHANLVIVNAAIESGALVALDKLTGKEMWRTPGMGKSWSSPLLVETVDGKHEVVVSLLGKVAGYNPETGKELWHCTGIGRAGGFGYTCSTPVARAGIVYAIGGGGPTAQAAALAIKTGGRGDVTKTHVLWRARAGTTMPSPVLCGEYLHWVAGTANCLQVADGTIKFQERLYGSRSEYVSAVAAGDRIYALTRFDGLYVLAGGGTFEKLGHYDFAGDTSIFNASPAVSDGRLYVRSNDYIFCIGNKVRP
jgi:outer membrane protein assembly factor BamB